jgi:chromate transporter
MASILLSKSLLAIFCVKGAVSMSHKTDFKKLYEIFITFFRIGAFTFGGGYAMIPLIQREVVDKKKWIKEEEIIDVFAVSESMPGAIAINSSILIGYKIKGKKGACAAAIGVILPSFIIITLIAAFFARFQDNPFVKAAFKGIRPAVVALISIAAVKIGKAAIKDSLCAAISIISFILVFIFDIHAIFAILGGAAVGIILYKIFPNRLNDNDNKGAQK